MSSGLLRYIYSPLHKRDAYSINYIYNLHNHTHTHTHTHTHIYIYIYIHTQLSIINNDNIFTGWDPLEMTWSETDVYTHTWQYTNGCKLVLEEAHSHFILTSWWCKFTVVNFVYSRILTFHWYQWGQSVPRLACWTCIPLFCGTLVPKHVGVCYLSWIVWFIVYWILLSASVGWYT
jgi:hypothetical protein